MARYHGREVIRWTARRPKLFKVGYAARVTVRTLRPLALLGAVSALSGWAAAAEPAPPSLRVSGSATLTSETHIVGDDFEVQAALSDEVGRPLAGAELRARVVEATGVASLQRCGGTRREDAARLALTTDATGSACVLVHGVTSGSLELSFDDPRGYFARATRSVRLPESADDAVELGFDPLPGSLSLDQPLQTIGLLARAHAQAGARLPDTAELTLDLAADGTQRELTRVALDGFGEVHRLALVSATFRAPGPARLIARLRTRDGVERASANAAILRTATVTLKLDASESPSAEPGATLRIEARSALGPAPSGVIEARSKGRSIAAAPVKNGVALLTLPAAPEAAFGPSLTLEYVGEGPGWLSAGPLELQTQPASKSWGRYAPWIAAVALAALAVVLGWRRPRRERPSVAPPLERPSARLEVLESFGARGGYQGTVRDAHEGTPLAGATLSFVDPGPPMRLLLQTRTSADGSFKLDGEGHVFLAGALLEVAAPWHATLSAPLPGPGVLQLSLVSRRRALLDRLVQWAERRGRPWLPQAGDPTPAQVATVAGLESQPEVGQWARALERLAYGPNPIDAAAEQAAGVAEDPKLGPD